VEEEKLIIDVETEEERRIDQFLADQMEYSRSFIQKLIKNERVTVNGNVITKVKYPVSFRDKIIIEIPAPTELEIKPEKMDLDILYEDNDVIVIDKPKGMVVHPSAGHMSHTLVNGLLYHCKGNLSGINGVLRPGIVHRIDMDTTGAIIACKNDIAHQSLAKQLQVHSITRKYEAIVYHNLQEETGTIDKPIGRHPVHRKKMAVVQPEKGKRAVTHYRVLSHLNHKFNYIECQLETGRTHQIRVHMASIMHPLLGDELYGPKPQKMFEKLQGQTLHAKILGFQHPVTNQYIEVESPLPQYFVELLKNLGNS
jgi:pseudouridine synthase, rluA family